VGESSKGVDPEGGVFYPRVVVQDARSCFRTMGISFKGSKKMLGRVFVRWGFLSRGLRRVF
jgi:hypothetical protein